MTPTLLGFAVVNGAFLAICAGCLLLRRHELLLHLYAFSLALSGVVTFWATVWTPTKIVGLFIVFSFVIGTYWLRQFRGLISLTFLTLAMSVLVGALLQPSVGGGQGDGGLGLQGRLLRPLVQGFNYASAIAVLVYTCQVVRTPQQVSRLLATVFWASVFCSGAAWVHFICMRIGVPFLPIPRYSGGESVIAAFASSEGIVERIYGLGGEPKYLAAFLLPGLLLQIFVFLNRGIAGVSERSALLAIYLTIPILIMTYSTGAYVSMAAGLLVLSWLGIRRGANQVHQVMKVVVPAVLVGILFVLILPGVGSRAASLYEVVQSRFVDRLETEGKERLEVQVMEYMFFERPESLAFGLGPGMYNYHGFGNIFRTGGVQPMTSMWAAMFADIGLVGLILNLTLIKRILHAGFAAERTSRGGLVGASVGGLVGCIVAGIQAGSFASVAFFAGLVLCSASPEFAKKTEPRIARQKR